MNADNPPSRQKSYAGSVFRQARAAVDHPQLLESAARALECLQNTMPEAYLEDQRIRRDWISQQKFNAALEYECRGAKFEGNDIVSSGIRTAKNGRSR